MADITGVVALADGENVGLEKRLSTIEDVIKEKHKKMSSIKTTSSKIKKRPDGFDYVEEHYMRELLNDKYPIWSWEKAGGIQVLGSEWVIADGTLTVIDEGIPRKFWAVGAAFIQKRKKDGAILDVGNNAMAAISEALKRAINRLCNIADDVYRKEFTVPLEPNEAETLLKIALTISQEKHDKIEDMIGKSIINKSNFKGSLNKLKRETQA